MTNADLEAAAARVDRALRGEPWAHESLPPVDAAVILIARERVRLAAVGQHEAAALLTDACRALTAARCCVDKAARSTGCGKMKQARLAALLAERGVVDLEGLRECMRRSGYGRNTTQHFSALVPIVRGLERLGVVERVEWRSRRASGGKTTQEPARLWLRSPACDEQGGTP